MASNGQQSNIGEREIRTQQRALAVLQQLGYRYLGNWAARENNRNIETEILTHWLQRRGTNANLIERALRSLDRASIIAGSTNLYETNRAVYDKLRYGVKVKPSLDADTETVHVIDWANPSKNDFAVAEEVTIEGPQHRKRPDLVLYVNGIAFGVLELKRATVSMSQGIRQHLDNQKKAFIEPFFTTVQLLFAGNESEGLRYGVIETPEKYWLRWVEPSQTDDPLGRDLTQLCRPERLLEIIHDFIVFDAGTKKTCRHNQYFGVRAAQEHITRREGGIVWHTQGSGKSLTMVWLAKWIREHVENARVLLVTDRTELDEQIEKVFEGVDEHIYRTQSGADLVGALNDAEPWLICSLIQKFGRGEEASADDVDRFVADIQSRLPKGFRAKGRIFVFVDECHRTQSGKLHDAMTALVPDAVLIGFTGTPLLKKDKQTSLEVFGPYIHTYKFDQAVRDGVVLDLRYEARDIDQQLTSPAKVDQWFDAKTRGLTDLARAQLKQRWGTLRKVMSSEDRLHKIVDDILIDMATRDRLASGHGNALMVSDSVYAACRFYDLFQRTDLAGRCAIVTSYKPQTSDIKGEDAGEGLTEKLRKYEIYREMLADHFDEPKDTAMYKAERFEKDIKKRFIESPGQMKLLIVVDKLLTGFDAPPATYLYIDKNMRDHGLFQAICRVNRLDGEDKDYGYIVDYKDLFRSLEGAINDYTGEAFDTYDADDVEGLLKNRLDEGGSRLEEVREQIKALCEPVAPPYDRADYCAYFVGPSNDPVTQKENEPKRLALYRLVSAYVRAYANVANEMDEAGYSKTQAQTIREEVAHYEQVREQVKLSSGDYIDLKMYEPAMRHLLDRYIRAEDSEKLSAFDDMTLVELIVERGEDAMDALPESIQNSPEAMAETIENNVRKLIVDEMAVNPRYYERMSELLDALIAQRRQDALDYQTYLDRIIELARRAKKPETANSYPPSINSGARRALYDALNALDDLEKRLSSSEQVADVPDIAERVALKTDDEIRRVKQFGFRGNHFKEKQVRNAIKSVVGEEALTDQLFELAKSQRDY
ncbi:type I restriction endonuclease subunit R [Salinisphaera sp.]|uniref:type I restriction endonuclease subunit R n=1 Tax=Salinisphaera sp. TaxID=1914330 RepID=UPI000C42F19F|nr:HsdR family type I site-specific deoxyribonuclease [Salinisphaera sp.]MAS08859.1 restriction endonuclease subunit R [Salinisphaera sp.]